MVEEATKNITPERRKNMNKRLLAMVLAICLLMGVFSVGASASESDVGWTDARRDAFMERVETEYVSFEEMVEVMDQDEELSIRILNYLSSVSRPIDEDDCAPDLYSSEPVIRPDLSDSLNVRSAVKLFIRTRNGSFTSLQEASGCLIGDPNGYPEAIVTSAHCVYAPYDVTDGNNVVWAEHTFATEIMCAPAAYILDGNDSVWYEPLGYATCSMDMAYITPVWRDCAYDVLDASADDLRMRSNDWALLPLRTRSSNFTRECSSFAKATSGFVSFFGYPYSSEYDLKDMLSVSTDCMQIHVSDFSADIYKLYDHGYSGMSGSPVFRKSDGLLIGVYSGRYSNAERSRGLFCGFNDDMLEYVRQYSYGNYYDDEYGWLPAHL